MAAGSKTHDFAGGFGAGGAAAMQNQQQQDQQRYERAQEQFRNQQEADTRTQEQITRQAQTAQSQQETLKLARDMDLHSPEKIEKANDLYGEKQDQAMGAGGVQSKIMIGGKDWNGMPGNADNFYQTYTKNPDAFKAPSGYNRVEVLHVDTSGLNYDEHTDPQTGKVTERWLDSSGQPVDMDQRTQITFFDTPYSAHTHPEMTPGTEVNKLYGGQLVDPDKEYPLTLDDRLKISNEGIHNLNDTTRADTASKKAGAARGRAVPASKDPDVNKMTDSLLAINANDADMETALGNSKLSATQKNEARKLYKQLQPAKAKGSDVRSAINAL
ncbi:MAG: hypothetical protein WB716_13005, partial [Candidatus Acidiferrales bacterium]